MARLSWPEWMPKPLQSGFSMQPEDRRIASSTVGTSFQRGFGGDVCIAEVSLTLNRLQAAWLERFERDETRQGAAWFDFPLWYGGEVHWEECRFKTRPKLQSVSGMYASYAFSLYVKKRSEIIPDCLAKILFCWPPCFFFDFHDYLEVVFSSLSAITADDVSDALAGMYEE